MSALYLTCNRNKRSLVLDLRQPGARDALLALVKSADVFMHNNRPQVMTKLGLDYADMKKVNPKLIYCGAYGYSQEGPLRRARRARRLDPGGQRHRDAEPDGARRAALPADHRRRQDHGADRGLRRAGGAVPPRAHRRRPGARGADVRDHGQLRDGRAPLGHDVRAADGAAGLRAADEPPPQALQDAGRLHRDPAVPRRPLGEVLQPDRPSGADRRTRAS